MATEALGSSDVERWIAAVTEIGLASKDSVLNRWEAVSALLAELEKQREHVWLQVSFAFWAIGEAAIEQLIESIPHMPDALIRAYVGEILGEIGENAVNVLCSFRNTELWKEIWVQRAVVWALGWIDDEESRPLLAETKYSTDMAVRAYSEQALRKLDRRNTQK